MSYVQHIAEKLPESMRSLLPPQTPEPQLSAADDADGTALYNAMHEKLACGTVTTLLGRLYGGAGLDGTEARADERDGDDERAPDAALSEAASERRLVAFFENLLRAGMQSFSHMLSVVERYDALAKRLASASPDARRIVVRTVAAVWQKHPPTIITVLDRFQK